MESNSEEMKKEFMNDIFSEAGFCVKYLYMILFFYFHKKVAILFLCKNRKSNRIGYKRKRREHHVILSGGT